MKWFKHYSNASTSAKLNLLMDKFGTDGYGKYWLLVELLADKFDGIDPTFELHLATIKLRLRIHHDNIARKLLVYMHDIQLIYLSSQDNLYTIYFPKLLEIKDNHTRNLQVNSKLLAPRKEKKRKEKRRGEKNKYTPDDVINLYNKNFGEKLGYCRGLGSGEHLNNFLEASSWLKDDADWQILFDKCKESDTLMGIDGKWNVNLTWLVNYDNAIKVLNGNYDNGNSSNKITKVSDDILRMIGEA